MIVQEKWKSKSIMIHLHCCQLGYISLSNLYNKLIIQSVIFSLKTLICSQNKNVPKWSTILIQTLVFLRLAQEVREVQLQPGTIPCEVETWSETSQEVKVRPRHITRRRDLQACRLQSRVRTPRRQIIRRATYPCPRRERVPRWTRQLTAIGNFSWATRGLATCLVKVQRVRTRLILALWLLPQQRGSTRVTPARRFLMLTYPWWVQVARRHRKTPL